MFWGITLENGKRYTQVVERAFHVSMASLEQSPKHKDSFVGIMFEHEKSEFLLCTLQHGNLLQQSLDLNFMADDTITLYLNGDGIVHLTGYIMEPEESESDDDERMAEYLMGGRGRKAMEQQQYDSDEGESETSSDNDESDEDSSLMMSKDSATITELNSDEDEKSLNEPKSGSKRKADAGGTPGHQPKKSKSTDDSENDSDDGDEESSSEFESDDDDDDDDDDDPEDSDAEEDEKPAVKGKPATLTPQKDNRGNAQTPKTPTGAESSAKKNKKQKQAQQQPKSPIASSPQLAKNGKGSQQQQSPKKTPQQPTKVEPKTPATSNGISPLSKRKLKLQKKLAAQNAASQPTSPKTPVKQEQSPVAQTKSEKKKNKLAGTGTPGVIPTPKKEQTPSKNAVNKLPGGTQTTDVTVGSGPVAKPGKMVQVYYVGKVGNKEFDSCSKGKPFKFRLGAGEVIKGWDAGVQGMKVGGKRKIVVPPNQGYGSKTTGPIPANSTLDFEVQLISVL